MPLPRANVSVKAPDPFAAAAQVVNGTVEQLFKNKIYKSNRLKTFRLEITDKKYPC